MAHAVPTTSRTAAGHRGKFTERLRRNPPAFTVPALLAVTYGLWAFAIERHAGPITWQNVVFGVVSGVIVGVLCFALHAVSPRLPIEARAVAWAVFAGAAFGFLYAQSDHSVVLTIVMGLIGAVSVAVGTYYFYSTRSPKHVE